MFFCRWFLCLFSLALVSCAASRPAYQEQGWASYVADHYTGRHTSSGEVYYPQGYTAAHTSLPFGTLLTVKNVMNGRTVNVTVNDRFPYYPGRVINLSSAAAQHIGIPYMQMGQVQVTAKTLPAQHQQQRYPAAPSSYAQGGGWNSAPAHSPYPSSPAASTGYASYPPSSPGYPPVQQPPSQPMYGGYQPQPAAGAYYPPVQQQAPAKKRWGAPNAPGYSGYSATPPGLKTF